MKKFKKKQFKREEVKKRGLKRFFNSFSYSFAGLVYAYKYEQSMFIHFVLTVVAVILGLVLEINAIEWLLICISMGVVLVIELLNTSIEAVVDLVTLDIEPLAKIAKDTGSAATFVTGLIAAIIGAIIFIPKIMALLEVLWKKN